MQLFELKETIVKKKKLPLYVFTGEEVAVMDTYIAKIAKTFGTTATRANSVAEIYRKVGNQSFMDKTSCFVISNDTDFLKAEKVWGDLVSGKVQGKNIIILTYPTLDKRGKFYKTFSAEGQPLVEFEKLAPEILVKYIKKVVALNDRNCNKLIEICEGNYNRILLELDKVAQLGAARELTADMAFQQALNENLFYIPMGDIIFKFIDTVCLKNKIDSCNLWNSLKPTESPVKVVSLLYSSFRSILLVQLAKGADKICDFTGLTPWQVKLAKEKQGRFDNARLIDILKLIRETEKGIKTGTIEAEMAVDFLLVNILGA